MGKCASLPLAFALLISPCSMENRYEDGSYEEAISTVRRIQEEAKGLELKLQKLRSDARQNLYAHGHPPSPRREAAAGQAQTMDEQATGPTLKLCFRGDLKSRIYRKKPLSEQRNSNEALEIAICRDGQAITYGHLSSLRVEIVALHSNHSCRGNWTEEDFNRKILMSQDGQGSVLGGERFVKLVNGKAPLGDIHFKEGPSSKRREIVLAARVDKSQNIGGLRVHEAFMESPFNVLVERSEANEKSGLPKLDEKVYRLNRIAKGGIYSERLEAENIFTVQDFLKAVNKDANKLRQILKMQDRFWKAVVEHARQCDLREKHELKSYMIAREYVSLFFNCVHDLVGADIHGRYIAKDEFDPVQQALVGRLKKQAYNELEAIEFHYIMRDNRPIKIPTNVNADGSTSIPMSGASPHHHATYQEIENLYPCGIERALPDLHFGDANCKAAGPATPPDHCNIHLDQGVGQKYVFEGDAVGRNTAIADADMDAIPRWEELDQIYSPLPAYDGTVYSDGILRLYSLYS